MSETANPARILLVDDDRLSIIALQRSLKHLNILNETLVARDGQEALDMLKKELVGNGGTLPPFIVILDMNMPRMNGEEFLNEVDQHPDLQWLVIFVFETLGLTRNGSVGARRNVVGLLNKDALQETLSDALDKSGCRPQLRVA